MIQIIHVTKEVWDTATWRDEFDSAVTDYLRRSHEEIDERTMWNNIAAAIADPKYGIMLAVALKVDESRHRFAGYGIFRVEPGNAATGPLLHCWQLYSRPGVSSLRELYMAAESYIILACRQFGIKRMTLQTRRFGPAFTRLYGQIGFKPYAMAYHAEVPPYTREEIMAALEAQNGKRKRRRRRHRKGPTDLRIGGNLGSAEGGMDAGTDQVGVSVSGELPELEGMDRGSSSEDRRDG